MLPLVLLAACSRESPEQSASGTGYTGAADMAAPPPPAAPSPAEAPTSGHGARAEALMVKAQQGIAGGPVLPGVPPAGAMLIRTGSASIEVREVDDGIAKVRQLAASLGGHVANTSVQTGRDQTPSATLELKIPANRFDQAVSGLEPLGRLEAVNVNAQDVGEEYVDVQARTANAKRLEERLVALLAARTGRLEDVLAIERELARIRAEIERFEARLRYLDTHVAMSTLVVTVHEPHPVLGVPRSPIGEAFRDAWRNFVGLVAWTIAAMGVLIPLGAVIGVGAWVARGIIRRKATATAT